MRRAALAAVGCATLLALPGGAWAAGATGTASDRTPLPAADGSGGGDVAAGMYGTLLRLGIGLLVVVGIILAVWFLMKRSQRGRLPGAGGPGGALVDVVSTTPLGPNRFLHLIRVGEDLILVGATDQSVTPVARIAGDAAVDLLGHDVPADEVRAAFDLSGHRTAADPRVRAAGTARETSVVDRLRALTARR